MTVAATHFMKLLTYLTLIIATVILAGCSHSYDADKADKLYKKACDVGFKKMDKDDMADFLEQANLALDEAENFAKAQLKEQGKEEPYQEEDIVEQIGIWKSQPEAEKPMKTISQFRIDACTHCGKFMQHTGGTLHMYDYDYMVDELFPDYPDDFKEEFKKFYDRVLIYGFDD